MNHHPRFLETFHNPFRTAIREEELEHIMV